MKHIEKALQKAGRSSTTPPEPSTTPVPKPYTAPQVPAAASAPVSVNHTPQQPETVAPVQPAQQPPAAPQLVNELPGALVPDNNPNWAAAYPPLECDFDGFFKRHYGSGTTSDYLRTAYGMLRTTVLQKSTAAGYKKIGITSPAANAGKTVTSIHLALAAARRQEFDVVLADFDLRSPSIGKYIGAQNYRTVADYYREEQSIRDYMYRDENKSLNLVMNDTRLDYSAEYLAGEKTDKALNDLMTLSPKTICFFDLPPLLGCDDTIAFLPKLDGVILVAASDETQTNHMEEALNLLADTNIIATVLNKHQGTSQSYQYY